MEKKSAPSGKNFTKFDEQLPKYVEKIQVSLKYGKNNGSWHEGPVRFMTISRSFLRTTNVSDKRCRENQNSLYVQYSFPKIVSFMR
jgi:hypothetical protein